MFYIEEGLLSRTIRSLFSCPNETFNGQIAYLLLWLLLFRSLKILHVFVLHIDHIYPTSSILFALCPQLNTSPSLSISCPYFLKSQILISATHLSMGIGFPAGAFAIRQQFLSPKEKWILIPQQPSTAKVPQLKVSGTPNTHTTHMPNLKAQGPSQKRSWKECKRHRMERRAIKYCPLGMTWLLYTWDHGSYGYLACFWEETIVHSIYQTFEQISL